VCSLRKSYFESRNINVYIFKSEMYSIIVIEKILIPTDGYGLEDHVIKYVAKAFPYAEFHVISVVNTCERGVQLTSLLYKEMHEAAEKAIERAKDILKKEKIEDGRIKSRIIEGLPSREIIKCARRRDVDLVAMRVYSRKSTASAQRIGSTLKNVVSKCRIPVLTLAEECEKLPIRKILFPTDGSRKAERAKNFAIVFASYYKASIETLYVMDGKREHAEELLKNVEWKASFLNVKVEKAIEEGNVTEKILEYAKKNDLIIIGVGRKFAHLHYVGHVTKAVITHSPVPVISVHYLKRRWEKRLQAK